MVRKGITFWNTPVSVLETKKQKWGIVLFVTIFIPVFLLIFQPFGVNNYDPTHRIGKEFLWATVGFGFVGGLTLCFSEFIVLPFLFKRKTKGELILSMWISVFLLSSTIYMFYNILGGFHDWEWTSYFGFLRDVALMSIIPLGMAFLYFSYKNAKDTNEILLKTPRFDTYQKEMITLESENGKDSISVPLRALRYIEAQDNYVSIHYLMGDRIKKELLRTTMKTLEPKLKKVSVIRCHRSYMVNMNAVVKAKGTGHQLQLYLSDISFSIPVSRSYNALLKESMAVRHK